ncbi:MAG: RusA family crossover junction endodeoxyribonuclease [Synergistes sp.]|nr:RusA family crossover junction endodeoxyribonuclease [Synergistes sp.]
MNDQKYIIYGQTPSKSNCYRIIKHGAFSSLGKTAALKEYEDKFFIQCRHRDLNVSVRFRLDVDVYFKSDQPDLDNSLKTILDCLQQCRAIKNDRLCAVIYARKFVDKANPRIEYSITPLQ